MVCGDVSILPPLLETIALLIIFSSLPSYLLTSVPSCTAPFPPSHTQYEQNEQYVIAVGVAAPGTTFSVTATFSTGVITLVNQKTMQGSVQAGAYAHYTLNMVNPGVQLQVGREDRAVQ